MDLNRNVRALLADRRKEIAAERVALQKEADTLQLALQVRQERIQDLIEEQHDLADLLMTYKERGRP